MNLCNLFYLLRYRFFVFAGIFPYLFGASAAYYYTQSFNLFYFLIGFIGVALSLIGVEAFNEYFDSKYGGDFIFSLKPRGRIPNYILGIGLLSFLFAFLTGLYLTLNLGFPILIFAVLGFLAAAFYVGPPIKFAYRGLGETVIFLAYGPAMVGGSYFIQTQRVDPKSIFASLIPGLLIFALAIVNEIPDYFQDKLIGKKNIVVRIGRERAVYLYAIILFAVFAAVLANLIVGKISSFFGLSFFTVPLACRSISIAKKTFDYPKEFVVVIRSTMLLYLTIVFIFIIGYWIRV